MEDAIRRSSVVISGHQRLLMEDAISGHQWQSDGHQWSSAPLSPVGSHGSQSEVIKSQSDGHQWSSAPLSPVGSLGSQSEVIKSQSDGHQWSSAPLSPVESHGSLGAIGEEERSPRHTHQASSTLRPGGAGARSQRGASTYLPSEAISGHQFAIRCNQWSPELIKSQSELIKSQSEFIKSQSDSPAPERPTMATWSPAPIEIVSRCMVGRPCGEYDS